MRLQTSLIGYCSQVGDKYRAARIERVAILGDISNDLMQSLVLGFDA